MPAPILTTASTLMCPHFGSIQPQTGNTLALIDGAPALLATDQYTVVGCGFTVPPAVPSPCVVARWILGASQTKVAGIPVALQSSVGLCFNAAQVPQGPIVVAQVQQKAFGT